MVTLPPSAPQPDEDTQAPSSGLPDAIAARLATGQYATEIQPERLYVLNNRHGRFRPTSVWIAIDGRIYANRVCHRDTVVDLFRGLGLGTDGFEDEDIARVAGHRTAGLLRVQVHERGVSVSMAGLLSKQHVAAVDQLLAEHVGDQLWWQEVDPWTGAVLHVGRGREGWLAFLGANGIVASGSCRI